MQLSHDREQLNDFITKVYSWLDVCYLTPDKPIHHEFLPVMRPYKSLRPVGKEAWQELKRNQSLESFIDLISKTSDKKLQEHGLIGAQLRYKFEVLRDLVDRMNRVKVPGRFRPKLIDAIDTILDSLISAVNAGTALKEIKDMLRAQI